MDQLGGNNGYYRLPQTTSDINMGLPPQPQTNTNDIECTVREQDRFMPIANVIRIMRKILPPHAKISDDSKETIQECVSEFISFITGEANDRCQREQRKTITAEDVLWAMSKLGFDDYIEPLTLYLHRYRELDGGDQRGPLNRMVDHGFHGYSSATAFHHMAYRHGLFGSASMNGFYKDVSTNAGPSYGACTEPIHQCKDKF